MLFDFEGELKKVLGMKWKKIADNESLTIPLLQEGTTSALVEELDLEDANSVHPPHISGCPVDKITFVDHFLPS